MNQPRDSFQVGIHFESVLRAISKQIYETPHAFIRENVQNAVDAVRIQALRNRVQPNDNRYNIDISVNGRTVTVRDNGIGMSETDLKNYFWTIGASGKRDQEAKDAGCVGMFGIGGFANFGVCDELEVTSQKENSSAGTYTRLSRGEIEKAGAGIPSVTMSSSTAAGPRGTIVVGHLRRPPNIDDLKAYLRNFVRFVPIAITFNGERISQQSFADINAHDNFTPIAPSTRRWQSGNITIVGQLFEDRGHTLIVAIDSLLHNGEQISLTGKLRFENGHIDVFKRGFKLCATQIPSTIGISGRLDCDLFLPTAGRDSLDASTTSLLGQIVSLLETEAIDVVFESPKRIAEHTRLFRLIVNRGLIGKMDNVPVRLADGTETALSDIRRRANRGRVSVFFGSTNKQALNQVMQARGHIVVHLSSNRYRRKAEMRYLKRYCSAKPFDGMVDCAKVYDDLTRYELVFLSEIEQNISTSYEITDFQLIAGRLTEDIPAFVKEQFGKRSITIYVDVRHGEVTKLAHLGLNPLLYSLISIFCREYIGPSLKKWSPRYFGDGALNLERYARRRSELWVLVRDDISVVRKGGQRQIVTREDVGVIDISAQAEPDQVPKEQTHRILHIIDDDFTTNLGGYYIRLPDGAFRAYGDLLASCDSQGVVWTGNKIIFVASDGISAQFQYEIRLDEIIAVHTNEKLRTEGVLKLRRFRQEMFGSAYFPIPTVLEKHLVPIVKVEIRLELHCEWIDMRTRKLWEYK